MVRRVCQTELKTYAKALRWEEASHIWKTQRRHLQGCRPKPGHTRSQQPVCLYLKSDEKQKSDIIRFYFQNDHSSCSVWKVDGTGQLVRSALIRKLSQRSGERKPAKPEWLVEMERNWCILEVYGRLGQRGPNGGLDIGLFWQAPNSSSYNHSFQSVGHSMCHCRTTHP